MDHAALDALLRAAMGVAFDSYRVLAGQLRFPQWSKHTLDFLYWIAAAFFIFRMLYVTNDGQLRFYVFVGLFIGFGSIFIMECHNPAFCGNVNSSDKRLIVLLYKLFRMLVWNPIKGILMLILGLLRFLWKFLLSLLRLVLNASCLLATLEMDAETDHIQSQAAGMEQAIRGQGY